MHDMTFSPNLLISFHCYVTVDIVSACPRVGVSVVHFRQPTSHCRKYCRFHVWAVARRHSSVATREGGREHGSEVLAVLLGRPMRSVRGLLCSAHIVSGAVAEARALNEHSPSSDHSSVQTIQCSAALRDSSGSSPSPLLVDASPHKRAIWASLPVAIYRVA